MRVLVLGIGNVMFADEGIGVHFVNLMAKNYKFTSSKNELTLMDGGTLALTLTHIISEFDYLIVVEKINIAYACAICANAINDDKIVKFAYDVS